MAWGDDSRGPAADHFLFSFYLINIYSSFSRGVGQPSGHTPSPFMSKRLVRLNQRTPIGGASRPMFHNLWRASTPLSPHHVIEDTGLARGRYQNTVVPFACQIYETATLSPPRNMSIWAIITILGIKISFLPQLFIATIFSGGFVRIYSLLSIMYHGVSL